MDIANTNASLALNQFENAQEKRILGKDRDVPKDVKEIKRLSEEFESVFLNIVFKSMRETVPDGGLIDGGNAEKIYRSMLDQEYSQLMAEQRSSGLADNIEEFLLRSVGKNKVESVGSVSASKGLKAYGIEKAAEAPRIPDAQGLQDKGKR